MELKLGSRKGQLHISETIAVLFIFFVLVVFGMIFYFKYQQSALEEEREQLAVAQALRTTSKVLFLPELICSRGEAEPEDNCIDVLKLEQVKEIFNQHLQDYYYSIFGYARITVVELYPEARNWAIYDLPKPLDPTIVEYAKESTFFVITLRSDNVEGGKTEYGFGYVQVEVYT